MKRLQITYGGETFTTTGRDFEDVQREISEALVSGEPHWMVLNSGFGRYSETRVLITPGVHITLSAVVDEEPAAAALGPDPPGETSPSEIASNLERGV